jgi:hypothetical protein
MSSVTRTRFLMVIAGITASLAATSGPALAAGPVPSLFPGAAGPLTGATSPVLGTAAAATGPCSFANEGDYVHVSSIFASGHGWWDNIDCESSKATVTVQLQEYFSNGTWRNEGPPGVATVYSGGGSANRATAKAECANQLYLVSWRSSVHVDVVGIPTLPNTYYTAGQNIFCAV